MDSWLIIIIILGIIIVAAAVFLAWWFRSRQKKNDTGNYMEVTCSTCVHRSRIDKDNPPIKIICPNCGKEGPVRIED